jgi:ribosomal protein L37AE/L43A
MIKVWCPRCSQGYVVRRCVRAEKPFWVCEECEAVWFGSEVLPIPENDLTQYLEIHNIVDGWAALTEPADDLVERTTLERNAD